VERGSAASVSGGALSLILEKGENLEPAVVQTLLIAENMDDEGNDNEGKEGSV
jgi:hypothetical protein